MREAVLLAALAGVLAACSAGHPAAPAATATAASGSATGTPTAGGAGATKAGGGKVRDPCALLTIDQVTQALGRPAAPGRQEPDFDTPECEWDPASGENGNVVLDVGPWDGDPGVKPLRLGTPVAGVGDAAWDGGNTGLYVRRGTQGLRVWVFNVHTQSSRLDLEKQLATVVLAEI